MSDQDQEIIDIIAEANEDAERSCGPGEYQQYARHILDMLRERYAIVDHNELALLRDGVGVRPMTDVEVNLMTQVIDLRRELAAANHAEATDE